MRRDVFIANDSGGLSVVATDALQDIIDDGRSDDYPFVTGWKALLLDLYGDDSMPVRIVFDEPLTPDEDAQWLARARWRIDTADGRLAVMGGFDPDVMASWLDETGGETDGYGVGVIEARPGSWRVDVYAHIGSMNGRQILHESGQPLGFAYRSSHGDRPFPLWLAKALEFSGEDDPGHEDLWKDVKASMAAGGLAIDVDGGDAIGFLVHVTPLDGPIGDPPPGGWFERDAEARVPDPFPLGLRSDVPDPELRSFCDELLGLEAPSEERPIADDYVEIIEVWSGDPIRSIKGGDPIAIEPAEAHLLYWIAGLGASSPRFELWVEAKGTWTPPASTADFAVRSRSGSVTGIGSARNNAGWLLWWTVQEVAGLLPGVPEGSTIYLATTAILDYDPDANPAIGRMLFSGTIRDGRLLLEDSSPSIARDDLAAVLSFVHDCAVHERLTVGPGAEREAFDRAAKIFAREEGALLWEGDVVRLADHDARTMILLAKPIFRTRFGHLWPMDPVED
jgi:hypothetical protein